MNGKTAMAACCAAAGSAVRAWFKQWLLMGPFRCVEARSGTHVARPYSINPQWLLLLLAASTWASEPLALLCCRDAPGVSKVEVSLLRHTAEVHFEGAVTSPEQLVAAVDDCGFDCRLQSVHNVDADDEDSNRLQVRVAHGSNKQQHHHQQQQKQ